MSSTWNVGRKYLFLFVNVYILHCISEPRYPFGACPLWSCPLQTQECRWKEVYVGGGRRRVMYAGLFIGSHPCQCFVLISLWHFRGWGKKATKQCNGEKDLQHSTMELKEAWQMKQMPRLPLTISSCYLSVQPGGMLYNMNSSIIMWEIYYVGYVLHLLILSSQASLSSVKSNEQMLLSCYSQHDGLDH